MQEQKYTASPSRSNRPGWSVSFRHPLRNDSRGRPGLKIRRGLGTADLSEAQQMVDEMNTILGDSSWWNALRRREAELRFSQPIVKAFFDEIQAGRDDPESLREKIIRLPSAKEDGYSRVFLVGTTGAGKTSLLRQLIGSDPDRDRFPSTAPAKTTVADIEMIQAEGNFESVVTFFSEFHVQANIEECLVDACLAKFDGAPNQKVAERLLNHRDQKFRLSYILGTLRQESQRDDDSDFSFDDHEPEEVLPEDTDISEDDRSKHRQVIQSYLERVGQLTGAAITQLQSDLDLDPNTASGQDREAARQLIEEAIEEYLTHDEAFHELVQDILDEVRTRFDQLKLGEFHRSRGDWPEYWTLQSPDRHEFIRTMRWFSSNSWTQYGRLLTPLVEGIRVKGPLFPDFGHERTKLALIDGQGLGHTPDSSSSVTTHVTHRFGHVDVILLVDNAQQPMQAAALSVLRTVCSSGYHEKLAIAFTHFDLIKGHNLRSFEDKRSHVMGSVTNALSNLKDAIGAPVVKAVEQRIDQSSFMLGGVDRPITDLPTKAADYMKKQIKDLIVFCQNAIIPPLPPEAHPVYDPTGIAFALQEAVAKFQGPWRARLGLETYEGARKEHWTRIKALNRRIASETDVEYDTLRPVADLVARLTESISRFLDKPLEWTRKPVDNSEEQIAISQIRRAVSEVSHSLAVRRLIEDHLAEWRTAYDSALYRGAGSTYRRASTIRQIYDTAAPLPDAVMTRPSVEFLKEIRQIVTEAISSSGGQVRLADGT